MGGGKARKGYLEKEAKENHHPLDSYVNYIDDIALSEFLSNELEYSPEYLFELIKKFRNLK